MEKDGCVKKEAVAAPEAATATPTPTLAVVTAPPQAPEKAPEKCYKKTVGEDATFLESAKDYFNQFKEMPAPKHWICLKNYVSQKYNSVEDPAPSLADNSNASQVWDDDDESDEEFEQLVLATYEHEQAIAAAALYGACRCREVLLGRLRVSEPSRVPCAV